MAESDVGKSAVINEETMDEISENGIEEDTRVDEILSDNAASDRKEFPKKGSVKGKKKGKIVKLVPREHACQPAQLPLLEIILYAVGWIAAAFYSLYAVLRLTLASGDKLHKDSMGPGWSVIGRKQDISNFEWTFWSNWFVRTCPWFFVHIGLGQLLRKWNNKHRKYVFLGYHTVAVFCILGIKPTLFVIANCVMAYVAAWCGSVILVWIVSLALVAFLNYDPYSSQGDYGSHPLKAMTDFNEDVFYLMVFSIAMANIRYTSFALDWIAKKKRDKSKVEDVSVTREAPVLSEDQKITEEKAHKPDEIPVINEPNKAEDDSAVQPSAVHGGDKDTNDRAEHDAKLIESSQDETVSNNPHVECKGTDGDVMSTSISDKQDPTGTDKSDVDVKYSLMDMFSYCLYLPYYFTGPITTYDEFYKQFHAPMRVWNKKDMRDILTSTLRVIFWTVFIEVVLHYFYINSIMLHLRLMWHIPLWSLAGIGYGAGQFFMVKYVVLFGLPGTVGKLDQLQPPQPPRCIAYIYKYSEMWKYFDRGLYSFLKRYIYVPLGGSRKGVARQLVASAVSFAYIFWFHGGEWSVFYWSLVNFLGICLETGGRMFADIPRIANWEALWLNPAMGRRVRALFGIPLLMMSALGIFTFFGGNGVGYIFLYRLLYEGAPISVLVISGAFYCFCQTSMEIERWRKKRTGGFVDKKEKLKAL